MTRSRGNARENQVATLLRDEGWIVGSMRHSAGGGDLIAARLAPAVDWDGTNLSKVRLVEVKSTAAGPWEHFGPRDRQLMLDYAKVAGATAWLAWWPLRKKIQWIPSEEVAGVSFDLTGVYDLTDDPEAPWQLIYTLQGDWIAVQLESHQPTEDE